MRDRKKMLLIEDDLICQKIYNIWLSELSHNRVDIARNAIEAHNYFIIQKYDVIVTDLGLPDKSGIEVIQAIRSSPLNQNTPIIVLSAHASAQTQQECTESKANVVLSKPASKEILHKAIQTILCAF